MSDPIPSIPRFHIDQPERIPTNTNADLGRAFDKRTRKVGDAGWDGKYRLVVFTPDAHQPHLVHPVNVVQVVVAEPFTLGAALGRLIALDDPRLYPLVGIAIQGDRLEAIKRARVVFGLGLAEAKSLIEAVLVEGSARGPITGVTLRDGRTVVVRQQDDDEAKAREAKEREGWTFTSGFPDSGGDDVLALDLREKGIEIRTMRAIDDLRARDMDDAFRDMVKRDRVPDHDEVTRLKRELDAANERAHAAEASAARLQAVIDAETGRKGLEGWVYSYVFRDMVDNTAWRLDLPDGRCVVAWGRRMDGSDKYEESNPGGWAIWMLDADGELDEEYGVGGSDPAWNALDAMEHATRRLCGLGALDAIEAATPTT